ncbi:hypothetical protein PR202_ga27405 [Eleusine coracana subsp. coracana]|uniref:Uncharacterized protein n=1 Tax=Eleusine coracana subsp. coracana TaxID=191504 RepID=A0AAV5DH31_ELECO|nr:hypothetical protein PR202_ga27405 [Eleusine coracana subsp. coracana]
MQFLFVSPPLPVSYFYEGAPLLILDRPENRAKARSAREKKKAIPKTLLAAATSQAAVVAVFRVLDYLARHAAFFTDAFPSLLYRLFISSTFP